MQQMQRDKTNFCLTPNSDYLTKMNCFSQVHDTGNSSGVNTDAMVTNSEEVSADTNGPVPLALHEPQNQSPALGGAIKLG